MPRDAVHCGALRRSGHHRNLLVVLHASPRWQLTVTTLGLLIVVETVHVD